MDPTEYLIAREASGGSQRLPPGVLRKAATSEAVNAVKCCDPSRWPRSWTIQLRRRASSAFERGACATPGTYMGTAPSGGCARERSEHAAHIGDFARHSGPICLMTCHATEHVFGVWVGGR